MSVGIGQSGAFGDSDAEMRQITVAALQPMRDCAERIHLGEMTKQHGRELRTLAAGRGAQVKHPHSGSYAGQSSHGHRAGLLHVIDARLVKRVFAGSCLRVVVIAGRCPGYWIRSEM